MPGDVYKYYFLRAAFNIMCDGSCKLTYRLCSGEDCDCIITCLRGKTCTQYPDYYLKTALFRCSANGNHPHRQGVVPLGKVSAGFGKLFVTLRENREYRHPG